MKDRKREDRNRSKISIRNLDLYYSDFKALKDVSLEIEENKITAFIGPSGCGKSTLLKSINRMNDLVEGCRIEGQILLDGRDLLTSSGDTLRSIQGRDICVVFQEPMSAMDPTMRIGPQVEELSLIHICRAAFFSRLGARK